MSILGGTGLRKIFSLSLAVAALATAVAAHVPATAGPAEDAFFTPPDPLPAGAPGDVVRVRASEAGAITSTVRAWQVMYHSTSALGQPNVVTGMILIPRSVDPATAPIVSFASGTYGPAFRCTPSEMERIGASYEQPAINDMLRAGYAVVMTDYEGYHPDPKTTYITGRSEGHAVIDIVRAAQRMPETGLSRDAKVVFRGYSQGGGASLWAAQLQPGYAPELNLVGAVGGGVPADLVQVSLQLDGKLGFGFLAYSLIGLDNAYPELDLENYLNETGRTEFARMRREACTLELLLDYRGKRLSEYTTSSPVLTPPWLARVQENKLGGTAVRVPVHQYHGTRDDVVDFAQHKALRDTYCKAGVAVDWKTYDTDHITGVYLGNAGAAAFIADRFAGRPATSNC
ncbi:lipase family protein [Saccharothrix mutabilis subsp. capreolus]|uniref:lipase family protein n=1 Tax=Saccharothrix mutabilis TaxID=33921 RepID=UPI0035E4D8CE